MGVETTDSNVEIRLLFFGAAADIVGSRSLSHSFVATTTSAGALAQVIDRFPKLSGQKLLLAVNQEYVGSDQVLCEGDELAIFTAVSGG